MRKHSLIGLGLVAVCAVAVCLAFPAVVYFPLGKLRHEAFFDGKPTSYWVRAFKHEGLPWQAASDGDPGKALREGGAAAIPVLREIAANPDENVRSEALRVLSLLGPEARDAAPELAAAIKQEDNSSRFMLASEALARADPSAAAETLAAVLRDKSNDSRRSWAVTELLKLAPKGQEALPTLQNIVNDPNEDVLLRVQAIRMLWKLGQPAEPLLAILVEVVTDSRSPAGVQALEALGEIGPAAKPALPVLQKLLENRSIPLTGRYWGPPHRAAVIHAVGGIGPDAFPAVPTLFDYLKTGNYVIRMEVGIALAHIGPEVVVARDAISATSITSLADAPWGGLAALPLVQSTLRTWVPKGEKALEEVREAVLKVDPDGIPRFGGR